MLPGQFQTDALQHVADPIGVGNPPDSSQRAALPHPFNRPRMDTKQEAVKKEGARPCNQATIATGVAEIPVAVHRLRIAAAHIVIAVVANGSPPDRPPRWCGGTARLRDQQIAGPIFCRTRCFTIQPLIRSAAIDSLGKIPDETIRPQNGRDAAAWMVLSIRGGFDSASCRWSERSGQDCVAEVPE